MATLTVLDSTGATQTVAKVTSTGTDVDLNSLPVALSTEGKAQLGAVAETAPASDTASSGLNGRLQRIAQRITSLIAQIPATLGVKASTASMSVVQASDDAVVGPVNETAPASDTASSGLNGRLQRVAQRISSLIALVPTALGSAAAAASFAVTASTEDIARTGIVTETAPASDTASSGLNGRLQRIAQRLTSLIAQIPATLGIKTAATSLSVTVASDDALLAAVVATNTQLPVTPSGSVMTTITRPANTTAYTANDVLGGAITIATGLTSGQRCILTSMDLMPQIGAIPSGMTSFRVYLYNVTPPSAVADNGAWDLASADRAAFLGYVDIGTPADLGSTLFCQFDAINKQLQLSGSANLFAYVVTNGAFTPAANSEVYQLRTHFVGL